ncbi:MAG: hypothetical protein GKS06_04565 [Acidobacteria bacterium]|nr:hypothetical protein [Acidobacteriota bacterium]
MDCRSRWPVRPTISVESGGALVLRAEEMTPADLAQVVWAQRWAVVALALVGAALGYGYSLFVPDRFTAETLVLVEDSQLSRDYVQTTSTTSLRTRLDTMSEQVLSRTRLEGLVREYDFVSAGGSLEDAVAKVRRRITLDTIGQDGFRLSFSDEDPRMAARVANALAAGFINQSTEAIRAQTRTTATGLQQQADDLQRQLSNKEAEIEAFKAANLHALPTQLGDNLDEAQQLRQQIRDNTSRMIVVRAQLDALPEPVTSVAAAPDEVTAIEVARQILGTTSAAQLDGKLETEHPLVQLEARRLQYESLLRHYTARHPDVRQLAAEIAALEDTVATAAPFVPELSSVAMPAAPSSTIARDRSAFETEISNLESSRTAMLGDLAEYERRVAAAPGVERQLRELERERDGLLRSHTDLASRTVEADLANDLQTAEIPTSRFRVVDPAAVPTQPTSPLRLYFLIGGALAGFGLVVGATFLREVTLQPVNSADELERFGGMDVLASIPVIQTPQRVRRQRLIRVASTAAVGAVLVVVFALRIMTRGF